MTMENSVVGECFMKRRKIRGGRIDKCVLLILGDCFKK